MMPCPTSKLKHCGHFQVGFRDVSIRLQENGNIANQGKNGHQDLGPMPINDLFGSPNGHGASISHNGATGPDVYLQVSLTIF
jgi:hypothetical protein